MTTPFPNLQTAARPDVLAQNLDALRSLSPEACHLIQQATPHQGVEFLETTEGISATVAASDGSRRNLASRRRPLEEGRRLAESVDLQESGAVIVSGFGLGYHVEALAERGGASTAIVVFEPDIALLRAVLERVDHSQWLRKANLTIMTDATDGPGISGFVRGREALFGLGIALLEHPPSKVRIGSQSAALFETVATVTRVLRTTLATSLMQIRATLRNCTMNLDRYVACPGIHELAGAAAGRPAIVVSAGPSLKRNMELLAEPGIRDRFVIIAVQTVLRQLLDAGIRPHFVTALDHAEISARFYEGLTESDVDGVTLIVEPKANPAILDAYPGRMRLVADGFLDGLIGAEIGRPMGRMQAGATVAHLAYYTARFLGCDPVVLVGQDLGFTDGQYYSSGAAIHRVWSGELGAFRSLEMMEWERIVRMRAHLQSRTDVLGRPIYTDAQMETYLVQFEHSFKRDAEAGLQTIDATEGGVAKAHTETMALADVLERYWDTGDPIALPPAHDADPARIDATVARLTEIKADTGAIERFSTEAAELLTRMDDGYDDPDEVARLIKKVHKVRERVSALNPAFGLVQHLNQIGGFTRLRADRSIALEASMDPSAKQRSQIRRDRINVATVGESAILLKAMLEEARSALRGGPKRTREMAPVGAELTGATDALSTPVVALVAVDPDTGGRGHARDLGCEIVGGQNALEMMLRRLARSRHIHEAVLLTHQPERVRALTPESIEGLSIEIVQTDRAPLEGRAGAIGIARAWSGAAWRGGLASATCFDEVCDAELMDEIMTERSIGAALLVGADWALLDPDACDEVIDCHHNDPDSYRLTFSQAPTGLAGCVIVRQLMHDLHNTMGKSGVFSTIGTLLAYTPQAPAMDPVASQVCARIDPVIRDAGVRCAADSESSITIIREALASVERPERIKAVEIMPVVTSRADRSVLAGPNECTVDAGFPSAARIVEWYTNARPDGALTIIGHGPALSRAIDLCDLAKDRGCHALHLRTDLTDDTAKIDRLINGSPDVISVTMHATDPEIYRELTGQEQGPALERMKQICESITRVGGLPRPLVVPRITRRDAVYGQLERFYDHWIASAGSAMIDPIGAPIAGERIAPIALPEAMLHRLWRDTLDIDAQGVVVERIADGSLAQTERSLAVDADPADLWIAVRHDRIARCTSAEVTLRVGSEGVAA